MTAKLSKKLIKQPKNLRFAVLATDIVLWTIRDNELLVRLIPVHLPPYFSHQSGLPGGLIKPEETAEQAVKRLILDKAKIAPNKVYLEQLYTFSKVNRDPRGRVVAVAYMGLVSWDSLSVVEKEEQNGSWWNTVSKMPKLAYDHRDIVKFAVERLKNKLEYTNIVYNLLPREFTLGQLQKVYEVILSKKIDKRNFRKKILALRLLKKQRKRLSGQANRPAELFSFIDRSPKVIKVI